jgi:hypothetical protein
VTLKEFVSDTLLQIVDAVAEARAKNKRVAPRVVHLTGHDTPVVHATAMNPRAFIVDFDVAVTVSHTTDTQAKGGVAIHVFEAGGHRSSSAEQSTVSRIKFEVPVIFE